MESLISLINDLVIPHPQQHTIAHSMAVCNIIVTAYVTGILSNLVWKSSS